MEKDANCNIPGTVYKEYSFILNSASVDRNSNKFYVCQIIQNGGEYVVYGRYGRVGEKGINVSKTFPNPALAIKEFNKRYKDKTGCIWGEVFEAKPRRYVLMDIVSPEVEITPEIVEETQVDEKVLKLVGNLVNNNNIHTTLKSFNIDSEKLPLGKLSSTQIQKAMDVLKKIEGVLKYSYDGDVRELSSSFWTLIPYSHGRKKPPVIADLKDVSTYVDFLDVLDNLRVTAKVVGNSLSNIYTSIKKEITCVDPSSEDYTTIQNYVSVSHGHTHKYKLQLLNLYRISEEESGNFSEIPNRKMLFHGSRTPNFLGILTNGLRLPNASQVVNGAALGYGIYFADSISKSFNYTTCKSGEIGYVLLCEVALGNKPHVLTQAPFDVRPPSSYTSRFARGEYGYEDEMCLIPNAVLTERGFESGFIYNEYCIYDTNHYRVRYVLELKRE